MARFFLFFVGLAAGISTVALLTTQYHERTHISAGSLISVAPKIENEATFQEISLPPSEPHALRIPILIYHTVHPERPVETESQKRFNVPPDVFEQQLQYLRDNGFTVISMDDFVADLKAGTAAEQKPIVLTFDDGSHGQYTYAFPLLEKYHDTATFYIYTHPIDINDAYFLSWDEVKEMAAAGMTIGSHSITHPNLSNLSPEQLHSEIFDSKKILEERLGFPIIHFASPFGTTSAELTALLAQAGYKTGRSTFSGTYHSAGDLLHLTGYFAPTDMARFRWIVNDAIK